MADTAAETQFLELVQSHFEVTGTVQRKQRIWINIPKENLISLCSWLHEQGFTHLSAISVTDWIKNNTFELTYHLWSYQQHLLVTVKTMIPRDQPVIETVSSLWNENAQIHERELHELFGVQFQGNSDLAPLFVEEWDGPPAFRKDFNWREYVQKHDYDKEVEREKRYYD